MRVLYLEGDPNGLKYVSGTLARLGVAHQAIGPGSPLPRELSGFQAAILSGFPRERLRGLERLLVQGATADGLGILMVGGPRSYARGGYFGSDLSELLPVKLTAGDDRAVCPSGMLVEPVGQHPILRGIAWADPVVVVGHNRLSVRAGCALALCGRRIETSAQGVALAGDRTPLLALREASPPGGRSAALAFSLSPPWSGGLTDWGARTVVLPDGDEEVGENYVTLVMNLVRWVAGEDTIRRPIPTWEELPELPAIEMPPAIRCEPAESSRDPLCVAGDHLGP
jgi:hypothetical protein